MILALDPGRDKCGLAVVKDNGQVVLQEVISKDTVLKRIFTVQDKYDIKKLVLGDGTASAEIKESLKELKLKVILIDESNSTLEARKLYWRVNPPQGWRRLIPTSLQTPKRAIDDYAAVVLAKKHLNSQLLK